MTGRLTRRGVAWFMASALPAAALISYRHLAGCDSWGWHSVGHAAWICSIFGALGIYIWRNTDGDPWRVRLGVVLVFSVFLWWIIGTWASTSPWVNLRCALVGTAKGPTDETTWIQLGDAYVRLADDERAFDESPSGRRAGIEYVAAFERWQNDFRDEAKDAYSRAQQLAPGAWQPLERLANVAFADGDCAGVRSLAELAAARRPRDMNSRRPTREEARLGRLPTLADYCEQLARDRIKH